MTNKYNYINYINYIYKKPYKTSKNHNQTEAYIKHPWMAVADPRCQRGA